MKITNFLYYVFINIVETLIRFFPVPTKTGCRKIGSPDQDSPVFLTCNFHLTVLRVKRALRGIDCYLLVANSKGINVWCASAGGLLNNHSVISIIKTSGIEEKVEHKKIILPQLAAPGIEANEIKKKTGWNVIWGPVDAKDIPSFLKKNFVKTTEMNSIRFSIIQRIEVASMWAFMISIILTIIWLPLFLRETPAMLIQVWYISLAVFLLFPLYEPLFRLRKKIFVISLGKILVFLII
ncbi:MAG: HgcAB-like fusion protein, partial [Candidatus Heimdallarchaeota archaeon]